MSMSKSRNQWYGAFRGGKRISDIARLAGEKYHTVRYWVKKLETDYKSDDSTFLLHVKLERIVRHKGWKSKGTLQVHNYLHHKPGQHLCDRCVRFASFADMVTALNEGWVKESSLPFTYYEELQELKETQKFLEQTYAYHASLGLKPRPTPRIPTYINFFQNVN